MPNITVKVPPSKTEQTVVVPVSYGELIIGKEVITGGTPIDSTPTPVPEPPATDGYKLYWLDEFINASTINENIADHNQAANGGWSAEYGGSFRSSPASVSNGTRSELQFEKSDTPSEGAIDWSVVYKTVIQNSIHSVQFHPYTSGGSASPGLWHENGNFMWVNWKGGTNTKYPTGVKIEPNVQYNLRLEYKFGSVGYLRFFINGKKVLDKSGIQVGDGSGQYFKLGTNGWGSDASRSLAYYLRVAVYQKA